MGPVLPQGPLLQLRSCSQPELAAVSPPARRCREPLVGQCSDSSKSGSPREEGVPGVLRGPGFSGRVRRIPELSPGSPGPWSAPEPPAAPPTGWLLLSLLPGRALQPPGPPALPPAAASVQPLRAGPLAAASTEWRPRWPLEGPLPASGCCPEARRTRPPTGPPLQSCREDT